MNFQKKQLKTAVYEKTFTSRRNKLSKLKKGISFSFGKFEKGDIAKIGVYFILLLTFITCAVGLIIYVKYIKPLPSIKELENISIAESSTIYDKDGNELYKVFKEKRTYVPLESIAGNMKNAIVAGEDKTFFENSGIDFRRMTGAFVYYILGKTDKVEGTSTISQQLIRNTLIGSERKLERKVKEMYLSYKLNSGVSKEKILELYLNKISFGHNAFGIEQAAQTFFAKSAKDLNVLEASMLASLPKGPSYYSPYNHPDRLIGYPYVYDKKDDGLVEEDESTNQKLIDKKDISSYSAILDLLINDIKNLTGKKLSNNSLLICGLQKSHLKTNIPVDNDGCTVIEYSKLLTLLNGFKITLDNQIIEYQTGRKDFILQRMLEDEYITFEEYRKSILDGIGFKFNDYVEKIKYPYFVFYVKDYIEKKYGTGMLEQAGLKIYTSIDPNLQDKAEKLVLDYSTKYKTSINADNAALVSIDNKTGQVVAMVGGRDYFDIENKGNVNIITSHLQPGSTFKPFVYALAMDKKQLGTQSPIYDVETNFGNYKPKNFDGSFMGKMTVSAALNHSRNIPAIKMYFYAGQESEVKKMLKSFGVTGLSEEEGYYGPPMALGTVEMKPIDLAGAYSVFANSGYKKEVTPILKIVDGKGLVIEDNTKLAETKGEKVFDEGSSYLISSILSDTSARPDSWNRFLTLSDRPVAAKTGTSTKQYKNAKGEKIIMPRNLWTVGYTPQYTTVAWVGNTDGSEVSLKGDGLQSAGPIWRDFMNHAHKGKAVERWKNPGNIKSVSISQISGFLTGENFPAEYSTGSLFKNIPRAIDDNFILEKVDVLCNGAITDKTPITAVKEIFGVKFRSFETSEQGGRWQGSIESWYKNGGCAKVFGEKENFVCGVDFKKQACERPDEIPTVQIASRLTDGASLINGSNYIELAYRGTTPVRSIEVLLGDVKIDDLKIESPEKEGSFKGSFFIPEGYYGKYDLMFRAIDSQYYYGSEIKSVDISQNDSSGPVINLDSTENITLKQGESYIISGEIQDQSPLKSVNIYIDTTPLKIGIKERKFTYNLIADESIAVGNHTIIVEAIDNTFNSSKKEISLTIEKGDSSNQVEEEIPTE